MQLILVCNYLHSSSWPLDLDFSLSWMFQFHVLSFSHTENSLFPPYLFYFCIIRFFLFLLMSRLENGGYVSSCSSYHISFSISLLSSGLLPVADTWWSVTKGRMSSSSCDLTISGVTSNWSTLNYKLTEYSILRSSIGIIIWSYNFSVALEVLVAVI